MRVIICGAGQVGYSIASYLSREENDVTVIDHDREDIKNITDNLDVNAIVGEPSSPDTLQKADAQNAEIIIAVTRSDEINMSPAKSHTLYSMSRVKLPVFAGAPIWIRPGPISLAARTCRLTISFPRNMKSQPLSHKLCHCQ